MSCNGKPCDPTAATNNMSSEGDEGHPEKNSPIEAAIDFILNVFNNEDLQLLLTDDIAWENFVAETNLSRDEVAVLREVLSSLAADTGDLEDTGKMEEKDILQTEQEHTKRFLKEFPQMKKELEECITQLHALADKADQIHRNCTISNVVASSTGIVSGVLTIAGLTLAPVTAGLSLALTATGMGLGTASALTSISTSIVEHSSRSSIEAEAKRLAANDIDRGKVIAEVLCDSVPKMMTLSNKVISGVNGIEKNIHAIKLAKNYPRLVARAKRVMTTGRISARGGRQVQKAFGGTALAMTKGARLAGAAATGLFILMDVASLVQDSKHLHEGAKTESAEQLKQQARELEMKLEQLKEIHESLQQD